ncbi:MAG: ferredoxin--NADP reductase, partial [Spirochaetota bacterium]
MTTSSEAAVRARPRVQEIRNLTESAYILRFDRNGIDFEPGQYVAVGVGGEIDMREYSIYSSLDADYLEILVKEVEAGYVSRRLRRLEPGDELEVDGPFGFFTIDAAERTRRPFLLVATGTGISPFHCFAQSYPDLDYRLLHGVRLGSERYEHAAFDPHRLTSCLSRDRQTVDAAARSGGRDGSPADVAVAGPGEAIVAGRVTDHLREHPVPPETLCYLCGNCDMIYEAFDV